MKRFQNILVMAGGKDNGTVAVERAIMLAKGGTTKVKLVDFIDPLPDILDVHGSEPAQAHREASDHKLLAMGRLAQLLRDAGVSVVFELIEGNAAEKAIQRVVVDRHDLVIKSAEIPPGIVQRLFGTTGLRLLRRCPCPVWIIKPVEDPKIRRILAAVEPNPPNQARDPLNLRILELASSLAENEPGELHIVYVWPHWAQVPPPSGDCSDNQPDRPITEIDKLQAIMLGQLTARLEDSGSVFHTHLLKGNPGEKIAELSLELDADLLVIGTIRRRSLGGFLFGGTAERVIDQVNCSVLAVKPGDVESLLRVP